MTVAPASLPKRATSTGAALMPEFDTTIITSSDPMVRS